MTRCEKRGGECGLRNRTDKLWPGRIVAFGHSRSSHIVFISTLTVRGLNKLQIPCEIFLPGPWAIVAPSGMGPFPAVEAVYALHGLVAESTTFLACPRDLLPVTPIHAILRAEALFSLACENESIFAFGDLSRLQCVLQRSQKSGTGEKTPSKRFIAFTLIDDVLAFLVVECTDSSRCSERFLICSANGCIALVLRDSISCSVAPPICVRPSAKSESFLLGAADSDSTLSELPHYVRRDIDSRSRSTRD